MRMTTIKRNIARIVAASMALAILAPAAPTYAATDGTAAINFDLDTLSSGVGRINGWETKKETVDGKQVDTGKVVQSGSKSGSGTSSSSTTPGNTFNTNLDSLNTGDTVNQDSKLSTYEDGTSTRINLPWWNGQTKKASPSTAENTPYGKWNFDGYKLKGWYDNQVLSKSQLPNNYLYTVSGKASQAKTYYAVFEADEGKTYKKTIKHEGLPSVFTGIDTEDEKDKSSKVLEAVTIEAKTISGYRAVKMSGSLKSSGTTVTDTSVEATYDSTTKKWKPLGGSTDIAEKYGFALDYDTGRFTGKMVNKDLEATITYAPDPTNPMTVTVVHHIVNSDGSDSGTPDKVERYSLTVEEDFSGKVAPLSAYIQTQTGESVPMYLLVGSEKSDGTEVTAGSESKKPTLRKAGGTSFDDETTSHKNNLLLPDDKTNDNTTQYITNVTKKTETSGSTTTNTYEITANGDSYALAGKMINQSIQVDYYYIPNPEYTGRIIVNYVDEDNNDITDQVVAALKSDGKTTISDTANLDNWYVVAGTDGKNSTLVRHLVGSKVASSDTEKYTADIMVPEMDGYTLTTTSPSAIKANNDAEIWKNGGTLGAWDANTKSFKVTMGTTAYTGYVTIKIFTDHAARVDIGEKLETGEGVKELIKVVDGKDVRYQKELIKEKNSKGEYTGKVQVKESDLPNFETEYKDYIEQGYTFDGWYHRVYENNDPNGNFTDTKIDWASGFTLDTTTKDKIVAKANKTVGEWVTYTFNYGNLHQGFTLTSDSSEVKSATGVTIDVLKHDADGSVRSYTWTDLQKEVSFPQHTLSGKLAEDYKVVWYRENTSVDMSTVTGSLFEGTTYGSGTTFLAYYEPTAPATVEDPQATPSLDTRSGFAEPTIKIEGQLNPSSQVGYVVTDKAGRVVGVFSYNDLYDHTTDSIKPIQGGNLSTLNVQLHPGQSYKLYEVMNEKMPQIGETFPSGGTQGTDYSNTPAEVYIKEAVTPKVIEDSENPGQVAIVVSPVTNGYQYALKDASGKVVHGYTSPDDTHKVVFSNLDSDSVYYVFVSPDGNDVADQQGLEVKTDTVSPSATEFSLKVIGATDVTIQLDGDEDAAVQADSIQLVKEETPVKITVPETKGFDVLAGFNYIGISKSDVQVYPDNVVSFTMPSKAVKVQVLYSGESGGKLSVNWDETHYEGGEFSYPSIEYTYPDIDEAGLYRVVFRKGAITSSIRDTMRADNSRTETNDGKAFTLLTYIQKNTKDDGTGTWQNYTGDVGNFTLTVTTGGLQSDRRGVVYDLDAVTIASGSEAKIATDSNATRNSQISENYFTVEKVASYQGSFDIDVSNGSAFAYAYFKEPTVSITDLYPGENPKKRQILTVHEGDTLATAIAKAQAQTRTYIDLWPSNTTYIDPDTGITYIYEGLYEKDEKTGEYVSFDTNQLVVGNKALYMYFSDDSKERAEALEDLENAISTGNVLLRNNMAKYATKLQLAIDAATLVLEQTSPKATTAQLKAALEGIQAYIATKGGSSGGSSSGGGGSSTRKDTTTTDPTAPVVPSPDKIIIPSTNVVEGGDITLFKNFYEVGVDGNWEQLDTTGENWKFHLIGGTYVTGSWALIRATYNGQKVDYFYHFDANGLMDRGWLLESTDGHWYYLSEDQSDILGHMFTGWVYNKDDGRWYYLDTKGDMVLGWKQISGKWYYFAPSSPIETWSYNTLTRKWFYNNIENDRPMGSLYINESTPDGYSVDTSGALRVVNPS